MGIKLSTRDAKRLLKNGAKVKPSPLPSKGKLAALAITDWCKRSGYPKPWPEHYFARDIGRLWRFDLCWAVQRVAVEINGGGWVQGRHNRGSSLEAEYEKLQNAAALGWRVIPVTHKQIESGALWPILELALSDWKEIEEKLTS
jgi:hypothetical protein